MGIEFGILRNGSSITLMGEFRADTNEDVFLELHPLFALVASTTGVEIDMYESASFEGENLKALIKESSAWPHRDLTKEASAFLLELMRVANHASTHGHTLSYFGL